MKILHVITGLNVGGAELMLCSLTKNLREAGVDQRVISLLGEGPLSSVINGNGIDCIHLNLSRGRPGVRKLRALAEQIVDYKPTLIHSWMYHACAYSSSALILAGANMPILWGIHHAHLGLAHNSFSTLVAAGVCGLLSFDEHVHIAYCAEASKKNHQERGYCNRRSIFIPNGYDPSALYRDSAAGQAIRHRFGIPLTATVIGMAGRYDPIKDHATFLEAAKMLQQAGAEVCFFLFGEGIDDANIELMKTIERCEITSSVVLAGRQDDMKAVYSALDFLVSSSRGEAFPNVICEAMLCEVPCIATDVGDCRRIIGKSGYIVPAGASQALGQCMLSAVNLPRPVRQLLGARARARIASTYSAATFLSRHITAYSRLAANEKLIEDILPDTDAT